MSIEKTYEIIRNLFPKAKMDSLEVVKQVEQYRLFWKPERASVILLAESHVPTSDEELRIESNKNILDNFIPDYPTHLVRFVYCLGYGEDWLLRKPIKNNGTLQFWKIFSSCVAENDNNLDFQKLTKSNNSPSRRLRNKIEVLKKMKEKGIWLLDASIVGINRELLDSREIARVLDICWDNHIRNVMLSMNPRHIIVIGKAVGNILNYKLVKLSIGFTTLPQPQGLRKSSEEQLENYKQYQRICSKYDLKR